MKTKKIVHLCLGCFFPDNFTYQENMLPKFHKELGYEVEVIASLVSFDKKGNSVILPHMEPYINENDILVTRLNYKKPISISRKLKCYNGTYECLEKAAPDILFIHGCQFLDIKKIIKYLKKHNQVTTYIDNHADFSNSGKNWLSKNILHKILWRKYARKINPYVKKWYGVLPARVDWLVDMYKLPQNKCELLVMGGDDTAIEKASTKDLRDEMRKKYEINNEDFLIITGGKIDKAKKQTLMLMKAITEINRKDVKLLIFGSVDKELKTEFDELNKCIQIIYIGWIDSKDAYKYFNMADLAFFPGRHSVLWEQAASMGLPMICKYWQGTTHVDVGGNVIFIRDVNTYSIKQNIVDVIDNKERYNKMKKIAQTKAVDIFSYKNISKRAIEIG